MTPIRSIIITTHAHQRYRQHTGVLEATDHEIQDVVRTATPVTKKSQAWYAPLVRAKVQPGAAFYYHEDTNLVLVCEHADGGLLRLVMLYPLVHALCFKMRPSVMRSVGRRNRQELHRQNNRRFV